jgi:hypothetical protein
MRETRIGDVAIELTVGDIARQDGIDAVVNAANAELRTGGGVAGALHRAAGPGLAEEARPLAPIRPGQAVITSGHRLPNRHVIHCLGPVYGVDRPGSDLLASCYREALRLAEENGGRVRLPARTGDADRARDGGRARDVARHRASHPVRPVRRRRARRVRPRARRAGHGLRVAAMRVRPGWHARPSMNA